MASKRAKAAKAEGVVGDLQTQAERVRHQRCLCVWVGPYRWTVVVEKDLTDELVRGEPLSGLCEPARRRILLDADLPLRRRWDVLLHELAHAWDAELGKPIDDEARANRVAAVAAQAELDLTRSGGRRALDALFLPRRDVIERERLRTANRAVEVGDVVYLLDGQSGGTVVLVGDFGEAIIRTAVGRYEIAPVDDLMIAAKGT
jgi:hypothetical protein